jgi:hypothetical protein
MIDPMTIIIAVLSLAVIGIMIYVVPLARKAAKDNNVPVEDILNSSEQIIKIVNSVVQQLALEKEQKDIIGKVAQAATLAVRYSEQLYKSGQCTKEERKQKAVEFVIQALRDANIEITAERELLINSVIESAVFLLPKTAEELKEEN